PSMSFIFFFQAEDGIRDFHVTGVQTWLFRSRVRETLSPSLRSWQSIQLARMTATELSGSLGDLATIASFAPVLAGALTRSLADPPRRAVWRWLSLAAVLNMMTAVISHRGSYTATFANLTLPVFGWLGFRSLVALADGRVARNTIRAGLAIFL